MKGLFTNVEITFTEDYIWEIEHLKLSKASANLRVRCNIYIYVFARNFDCAKNVSTKNPGTKRVNDDTERTDITGTSNISNPLRDSKYKQKK